MPRKRPRCSRTVCPLVVRSALPAPPHTTRRAMSAAKHLIESLRAAALQGRFGLRPLRMLCDPMSKWSHCMGKLLWTAAPVMVRWLADQAGGAVAEAAAAPAGAVCGAAATVAGVGRWSGLRCLELGAGIGAVGMASAMPRAAAPASVACPRRHRCAFGSRSTMRGLTCLARRLSRLGAAAVTITDVRSMMPVGSQPSHSSLPLALHPTVP